ncbi:hypothetical protein [Cohnella zeiphila]|uniref:Uncharacterized protein n=1 Tax=Cohnella zeiphila TaxID=2761120 RepID=A0A7X0SM93_9BACL|nr:hypothetical protein [Cohnella zeiphila]MBB6732582.1 hypothetical protein [Cohnella zeiphila]
MTAKMKLGRRDVEKWIGQPVRIDLKNGSRYVGYIEKVERGSIRFVGRKSRHGAGRIPIRRPGKARVAGFFPLTAGLGLGGGLGRNPFSWNMGFGSLRPGIGAAGIGALGLNGVMGMFGKGWPGIRFGIGMLQSIRPLLVGRRV